MDVWGQLGDDVSDESLGGVRGSSQMPLGVQYRNRMRADGTFGEVALCTSRSDFRRNRGVKTLESLLRTHSSTWACSASNFGVKLGAYFRTRN